jgi:hypothetical protein
MTWQYSEFEFDGVAMSARFSDGVLTIDVMANMEIDGRVARLWQCHFQGDGRIASGRHA